MARATKSRTKTPGRRRLAKNRAPTVEELAGDRIGCVEGPGDLSTNPKFMEGYGRPNRPIRPAGARPAGNKSLAPLVTEPPLTGIELQEGAAAAVGSMRKEIDALDMDFVGEGVGVAQAIDELRKALDEISACLDKREYEKAATRLAYGPVTENFVFLQRALAGLHGVCMEKQSIVQEIAMTLRCAYEDALPFVDAVMPTQRPLTEKERREARKALPGIKARMRAMAEKRKSTDNE